MTLANIGDIIKGTLFYFIILGVALPVIMIITGLAKKEQITLQMELLLGSLSLYLDAYNALSWQE